MIGSGVEGSPPVAEISTWQNNCAVSCTSVFLVNAFLSKAVTKKAAKSLARIFNGYYQTSLSVDQLHDIFSSIIISPADRQVIFGPVLRKFVLDSGIKAEAENMLSNEAFEPLAREFGFNVVFYADLEGNIKESGAIPQIVVDPAIKLALHPYYHHSHYDLIMDDLDSASKHNQSSFEESPHNLPIERGEEDALKAKVVEIIHDVYNPEQQKQFNEQIAVLEEKKKELAAKDPNNSDVKIVGDLAEQLKAKSALFFEKPVTKKRDSIAAFKQETSGLINNASSKLTEHSVFIQVLKNLALFIATLGIGYIVMASFNKVKAGNFFFFRAPVKSGSSDTSPPFKLS